MRISDWSSDVCSSDLLDLEREYRAAKQDPEFEEEFQYLLRQYVGRPNPPYFAERLTKELGGAKVYLKREELNHTGARSEERRGGKEGVSTCRSRWSLYL